MIVPACHQGRNRRLIEHVLHAQAGKAALVAEESAVSAANLARAARTQAALGAAMLAAQAYNQVSLRLYPLIPVPVVNSHQVSLGNTVFSWHLPRQGGRSFYLS